MLKDKFTFQANKMQAILSSQTTWKIAYVHLCEVFGVPFSFTY
jgi:hypothetical protein